VRKLLYASVIILTLVAARPGSEAPIRQGSSSPQAGSPLCLCSFVAPTYPPVARINNIQGVVRLRLSFDSNGNLEHSQVLEGGHVLLADSPAEAVKGWRACPSPETQENRQVDVTFRYVLQGTPTQYWAATKVSFQPPGTVVVETAPQYGVRVD